MTTREEDLARWLARPSSATGEAVERRIAKMARATAKVIRGLRAEGQVAGAARLEAAAIQVADNMRAEARR